MNENGVRKNDSTAPSHLQPGSFEVSKPKSSRKGHDFVFRLDACLISKSGTASSRTKFVMSAPTFQDLGKWKAAIGEGGALKADQGTLKAMADGGGGAPLPDRPA